MSALCKKCGNWFGERNVATSETLCSACRESQSYSELAAENAHLRRQVERLVPFSQEAFILGYAWNSKGFTEADIDEAWQGHPHLLPQLDAILADEPGEGE